MTTRIFVAALSALLFGTTIVGAPSARADGPGEDAEQAVVASIAALRESEHMAPLRRDADLDEAALIHAQDMASNGFVGHESPRSGDPAARVRAVGARVSRVGENVARAASPADAIEGLAASPAHRAQILAPEYTDVGVAVVEGEDGFYVVEVFATRPGTPTEATAPAVVTPALPPPSVADVPADGSYAALDHALPIAPAPADEAPYEAVEDPAYAQQEPAAPFAGQVPSTPTTPAPNGAQAGNTPSYAAYGPQYGGVQDPAAPTGAPYVTLQALPAPNVQGYWVYYGARWWYFPIPAGARPGQVLTVAPNVTGHPPGVTAAPSSQAGASPVARAAAPRAPVYAPPPPERFRFFRRSPRRW